MQPFRQRCSPHLNRVTGASTRGLRSRLDEIRNRAWIRHVDRVTAPNFHRRRSGSLAHELLRGKRNHAIVRRLLVNDELRCRCIAFKRKRSVLDDAHVESVVPKNIVDTHPSGAVNEAAVNENDVADHVSRVPIFNRRVLLRGLKILSERPPSSLRRKAVPLCPIFGSKVDAATARSLNK